MKMSRNIIKKTIFSTLLLAVLASASSQARSQEAAARYSKMAPVDQYLIADRNAEIAMARSAAPPSISNDAEVMILGRRGYETAVKGKNGFVCVVERSWMSPFDFDQFWNPKMRGHERTGQYGGPIWGQPSILTIRGSLANMYSSAGKSVV